MQVTSDTNMPLVGGVFSLVSAGNGRLTSTFTFTSINPVRLNNTLIRCVDGSARFNSETLSLAGEDLGAKVVIQCRV